MDYLLLFLHVLFQSKNIVTSSLLSGGGVLNKVTKSNTGTGDQMVVNIGNFSLLPNQGPSISLSGMSNNIVPITSTVMTNNVLNAPCKFLRDVLLVPLVALQRFRRVPQSSSIVNDLSFFSSSSFSSHAWSSRVEYAKRVTYDRPSGSCDAAR